MSLLHFLRSRKYLRDVAIDCGMNTHDATDFVSSIKTWEQMTSFIFFLKDAYEVDNDALAAFPILWPDLYLAPWERYDRWELGHEKTP